jgi:hypothetical protein
LAGWISQGVKSSARAAFVANCNLFAANGKCGDNSFLAQFQPIKSTRGKNKEAPGRQTTSLPLSLKYCAYKLYKVHGNMQCPLVTTALPRALLDFFISAAPIWVFNSAGLCYAHSGAGN